MAGPPATGRALRYAQFASLIGLLAFVGVGHQLAPQLRFDQGTPALVLFALVTALIPSALWLVFFRAADRQEVEPTGYVVEVFLLGAALAQAIVRPVTRDIFHVQTWLGGDLPTRLLGSILIVGATETFVNYAAVRYTVFGSNELENVMEGVVYGTAAGLGVATVFNYAFVVDSLGLPTTAAVLQVVITALSHGALGMVVGYFLGRAKVDRSHSQLVLGVAGVAVLNGLFNVMLNTVAQTGFSYHPWNGLLAAVVLAVAVSVVVFAAAERPAGVRVHASL